MEEWLHVYSKIPSENFKCIFLCIANITGITPCVEKLNLSKLKYNDSKAEDFFNTLERVILCLEDL